MEIAVYVVGTGRGPKKVGIAGRPAERLRWLQTGNGRKLRVLYWQTIPKDAAAAIEQRAHWLLRDRRTHGEWFQVSAAEARAAVDRAISERGEGEKLRFSVGRPPLNVKPTQVRLEIADGERIDALRGPGRRAEFIREAVKEKLKREEKRAKG